MKTLPLCTDLEDDEAAGSRRSFCLAASLGLAAQQGVGSRARLEGGLLINDCMRKVGQVNFQNNPPTSTVALLQKSPATTVDTSDSRRVYHGHMNIR